MPTTEQQTMFITEWRFGVERLLDGIEKVKGMRTEYDASGYSALSTFTLSNDHLTNGTWTGIISSFDTLYSTLEAGGNAHFTNLYMVRRETPVGPVNPVDTRGDKDQAYVTNVRLKVTQILLALEQLEGLRKEWDAGGYSGATELAFTGNNDHMDATILSNSINSYDAIETLLSGGGNAHYTNLYKAKRVGQIY